MMKYIATFYSHFGAIRYKKQCEIHMNVRIMPVPRDLSSSCGSCVYYETEGKWSEPEYPEEVEQIVEITRDGYRNVYKAKDC